MPVTLDVEDHFGLRARKPPREQEGDRLVHSLDERGVGAEVAQLARDPPGEKQVVQGAVERARTRRGNEMEVRVACRRAFGRGREDAMVDDTGDRIPLALLRARERQREPLARDEENARFHASAASSTDRAQCSAECSASTRARSAGPPPPV